MRPQTCVYLFKLIFMFKKKLGADNNDGVSIIMKWQVSSVIFIDSLVGTRFSYGKFH